MASKLNYSKDASPVPPEVSVQEDVAQTCSEIVAEIAKDAALTSEQRDAIEKLFMEKLATYVQRSDLRPEAFRRIAPGTTV